jgi:hypothetical protein
MGERTERVAWDLESERRDLGRNLEELERKASSLTDWRWHYRHHPFAVLGAAFGGALLLGLTARAYSSESSADREPRPYEGDTGMRSRIAPQVSMSVGRLAEQASTTWDHIAEALIGLAAAKAVDFVGRQIPGFNEEYSRRHGSHRAG